MWVAIQEKLEEQDFLKLPSPTPIEHNDYTEFPEPVEKYDRFSRLVVILDGVYGNLAMSLFDPEFFEKHNGNLRDAYNRIFGSQLHESYGVILQIAYCIPKKVESKYFSKSFEPVPKRGLIIRDYKINGFQAKIVYSEFLDWPWLKEEDIMKWDDRKVHGIRRKDG